MSDTDAIVQDPLTGLFGFRLEMGRDHRGARVRVIALAGNCWSRR